MRYKSSDALIITNNNNNNQTGILCPCWVRAEPMPAAVRIYFLFVHVPMLLSVSATVYICIQCVYTPVRICMRVVNVYLPLKCSRTLTIALLWDFGRIDLGVPVSLRFCKVPLSLHFCEKAMASGKCFLKKGRYTYTHKQVMCCHRNCYRKCRSNRRGTSESCSKNKNHTIS